MSAIIAIVCVMCRLEEMEWLMTRETGRETPQYFIISMSGNGAKPGLRQLSDYPHPYPSLRDLQKEIIRYLPSPSPEYSGLILRFWQSMSPGC